MKDVSLEDVMRSGFISQMSGVYTCIPCLVIGVSGLAEARVDVQPSINKRYTNERVEEHPPILSVPVVFPSSSTSSFTFPISVGDTVLCVFSQRGLDSFKSGGGGFVTPTDFRKFDKRDAIAIPGLFPFGKSVNKQSNRSLPHNVADAVISHNLGGGNEVEIRLKPDGSLNIKSPTTVNVQCKDAIVNATASMTITTPSTEWTGNMTFTGNITLNGNLVQDGVYTLDGVNMNAHVHGGVMSGPSKTSVPE